MKDPRKTRSKIRNSASESGMAPPADSGRAEDQDGAWGTLFVTSTPIGNLEDITLRALRTLKEVDTIAAENVAHTRGLCEHYGIRTRLTGYNQHNQKAKAPEIIDELRSGRSVAIVTDAGTPGISDPGVYLINSAALNGIEVTPIPGPSAVIAALSVSGMPSEAFLFSGFLSSKAGKRRKALEALVSETRTMVFFEAPHRIKAMLADLMEILGDRRMVMIREMTKVFEEVKRGPVSLILENLDPGRTRGEFTLVVAGSSVGRAHEPSEEVISKIDDLLRERRTGAKDIALLVSEEHRLPYRQVYKECLNRKKEIESANWMESVKKLKIRNSLGLHARAAAKIVDLANRHESSLFLRKDDQEVDGSSILSVLTLSCPRGTELEARIVGEDAESFMEELSHLFAEKFGEPR
jgi:16S rRNA (cytidine1402-2'-O)-methyltransferase